MKPQPNADDGRLFLFGCGFIPPQSKMQPPIPAVPKSKPNSTPKKPFFGLNVACGIEFLFSLAGFLLLVIFAEKSFEEPWLNWLIQALLGALYFAYFALIFFLWRGHNWARWIFVALAPLSVFNFFLNETSSIYPQIERIYNHASAVWVFGMAIWLLLPNVARHFVARKSDTETEINAG